MLWSKHQNKSTFVTQYLNTTCKWSMFENNLCMVSVIFTGVTLYIATLITKVNHLQLNYKAFQIHSCYQYILFQVSSAIDISHAAYSTLQNSEVLAQVSNRMLLLNVTDGQSTAMVMEYRHIPHLDCNIKPGTKVLYCKHFRIVKLFSYCVTTYQNKAILMMA